MENLIQRMNEIMPNLPEVALEAIYAEAIKYIAQEFTPNSETEAALKEVEFMKQNPDKRKVYSDFSEILSEATEELKNEI